MTEEVKKLELKVMALRERLGQTVVNYEDQIADLRVSLTMQNEKIAALEENSQPVEGEVVE